MARRWSDSVKIRALSLLAGGALGLLKSSWRVQQEIAPETQHLLDSGKPVIYAIWHGRMYGLLHLTHPENLAILVSPSNDGELITQTVHLLGFRHFIRGSHKRGGTNAIRGMLKALKEQRRSICFTVDGPRGPRHTVKPGIIRLASQAGVPIIPMVPACKQVLWQFNRSWDRYHGPVFFGRSRIFLGEPFYVPESLESDDITAEQCKRLEGTMRDLARRADASFGHADIIDA